MPQQSFVVTPDMLENIALALGRQGLEEDAIIGILNQVQTAKSRDEMGKIVMSAQEQKRGFGGQVMDRLGEYGEGIKQAVSDPAGALMGQVESRSGVLKNFFNDQPDPRDGYLQNKIHDVGRVARLPMDLITGGAATGIANQFQEGDYGGGSLDAAMMLAGGAKASGRSLNPRQLLSRGKPGPAAPPVPIAPPMPPMVPGQGRGATGFMGPVDPMFPGVGPQMSAEIPMPMMMPGQASRATSFSGPVNPMFSSAKQPTLSAEMPFPPSVSGQSTASTGFGSPVNPMLNKFTATMPNRNIGMKASELSQAAPVVPGQAEIFGNIMRILEEINKKR